MVVQACNLSIQEAEAGRSQVQGQFGLHSETKERGERREGEKRGGRKERKKKE
jgi:hypothetical protein